MLDRAVRGEFPRPGAVLPEVDPDLERICLKAMAHEPDARFASPRALAEALDEWLAEERARAVRDAVLDGAWSPTPIWSSTSRNA